MEFKRHGGALLLQARKNGSVFFIIIIPSGDKTILSGSLTTRLAFEIAVDLIFATQ